MPLTFTASTKRVLRHAAREAIADQVSFVASGVAFRVALATFPGIALLVWLGSQVLDPSDVRALLQTAASAVPDSTRQIIDQAMNASLANNPANQGGSEGALGPFAPLIGLAFTLWSANSGMKALFKALNLIHETQDRRSWLSLTAVTLLFTLGALFVLLGVMVLTLVVPHLLPLFSGSAIASVLGLLRWPVLFAALALALALLFRVAPQREHGRWPLPTIGSLLAALLLVLSCLLFSWFTGRFGSLAVTYGSLSTVVAFLLWLWLSFTIVLCGAELDAAIGAETVLYQSAQPRCTK